MTIDELSERLGKLEILFAEQEYTIETLNRVITRQDRDIDLLQQQNKHLKQLMDELKKQAPGTGSNPAEELPPHY